MRLKYNMANLSINYDDTDKLDFTFSPDSTASENINLLKSIMKIAGNIALKIIEIDSSSEDETDSIVVNECLGYLKLSEFYKINKKLLDLPVPAVHPLLSFDKFKK